MKYLFENVFYKKSENKKADELVNISYWVLLTIKNIMKWILLSALFKEGNTIIFILLVFPLLKVFRIGIGNIYKFKQYFRVRSFIVIMGLINLLESYFELPSHFLFPVNRIYLHTIYFKIYDMKKYIKVELLLEVVENIIIIGLIVIDILNGFISLTHILSFVFSFIILIYYIGATFYFLFLYNYDEKNNSEVVDEYGRISKSKLNFFNAKTELNKSISNEKIINKNNENDSLLK